jgi:hypothetical protein
VRAIMLGFALSAFALGAAIGEESLPGTYKLISSTRIIVETGEIKDAFGKDPNGYIMYGMDGRMLVLITSAGRPKPSIADMTDQDRAVQYRTLNAYGGTYTFHDDWIEHHIDIATNESRVGTNEVRDVKRDGDRLIYTTKPQPFPGDGKISVITLVWERVR